MSSVYATEPATAGRVIFETTHGPIDIRLWCRECPATTKFFLQLCADGFYQNMLFHRIVPSLLVQTGAIRQNNVDATPEAASMAAYRAAVDADQALERRKYEVNARLRFNHRGQVAMALGVSDDDNDDDGDDDKEDLQPQFFITTEDAPYLDGKHVIFGTLGAGPTIFNVIRMCSSTEVDKSTNQPVDMEHAPRIVSVKIVENPIHESSIVPQVKVPWRTAEKKAAKKKKKRKGKLDANVLSFGDEMGEVFTAANVNSTGKSTQSTHDALQSKPQIKQFDTQVKEAASASEPRLHEEAEQSTAQRLPQGKDVVDSKEAVQPSSRAAATSETTATTKSHGETKAEPEPRLKDNEPETKKPKTKESKTSSAVSLVEARRAKYAKGRKSKQQREEDTLARLMAFKGKVGGGRQSRSDESSQSAAAPDNSLASRMARRAQQENDNKNNDGVGEHYHGQVLDSDGEDDTTNKWLQTKFKCRRHIDHSAGETAAGDGRHWDDYKVIDDKKRKRQDDNDDGDGGASADKRRHHHHHNNNKKHKKHRHHDRDRHKH